MNTLRFYLMTLTVMIMCGCSQQPTEPIVKISSGKIEGTFDEGVYAFKGIPYAQAERFMPPREVEPWADVRSCKEFGPWAKQVERRGISAEGDGDFLINVWSEGLNDGKKRPIMVWIHGGGFSTGSANASPCYDGESLAKKGVVLMSINHRLDIMGFLDLSSFGGKWEQSVNVGMLDIVEALKWIKKNAKAFGGDVDNVTLFGESGGGGKVGTLMCMPEAKGLFNKAIIESGAKHNITTSEISRSLGAAVVSELGISPDNLDQINDVAFEDLMAAGQKCMADILGPRTPGSIKMWGFVPTVDGTILPNQPYMPGFSPLATDIPVIIGSTFNELDRTYYADSTMTAESAERLLESKYGEQTDAYIEAFKEAYPDRSVQDMVSIDSNIRALSIAAADAQSAEAKAPVYVFLFNWYSHTPEGIGGSYHGLELPFVFNNTALEGRTIARDDQQAIDLANKISDAWVNFAKTGRPSAEGLPEWEKYDAENGATMIFDNQCQMKYNFDRKLQDILTSTLQ